ncbi:alkaline phosphatase D family protein [Corynebacterium sp. H130]|uniref:alkaline phosphatase D family protein n=1 Tax=Corynebacterium sp. H130 TaxID=3133444 RepID=UPI003094E3DA
MSNKVSRRSFMQYSAVAAVTASATGAVAFAQDGGRRGQGRIEELAGASQSEMPFIHGVASGDPLPTSIILWTRVTPDRSALPGSTLGDPTGVQWEIATDMNFEAVVGSGEVKTSAEKDHTVKIEAGGLQPATEYFYRFMITEGPYAGKKSPIGRTKTAPRRDVDLQRLNFALASCANWEAGHFAAYRDIATRGQSDELDFVVFLGDYIYEYGTGDYSGKHGVVRPTHPEWEILTLEDYRIRYGHYRTDPNLQAAHAALPWIVMWDDHETANNSWRDGAENHTEDTEGPWLRRRDAAMQAYFEWLPVRATSPSEQGHLYRSLRFGNLLELHMMDLRTYRDSETSSANFGDPSRTMLGSEQFNWVSAQVAQNSAKWNVLGNSVMVTPLKIFTIPGNQEANEAIQYVKQQNSGSAINSDQWDGYSAERDRLLEILAAQNAHTLFITGDIHSEWANSVFYQDKEIGCEVVCTSVTSPNIDDLLTQKTGIEHAPDNSTSLLVEGMLTDANPWVKHLDFDAHGYSIARMLSDEVTLDFVRVANVEDPNSPVEVALSKTWRAGQGFIA